MGRTYLTVAHLPVSLCTFQLLSLLVDLVFVFWLFVAASCFTAMLKHKDRMHNKVFFQHRLAVASVHLLKQRCAYLVCVSFSFILA